MTLPISVGFVRLKPLRILPKTMTERRTHWILEDTLDWFNDFRVDGEVLDVLVIGGTAGWRQIGCSFISERLHCHNAKTSESDGEPETAVTYFVRNGTAIIEGLRPAPWETGVDPSITMTIGNPLDPIGVTYFTRGMTPAGRNHVLVSPVRARITTPPLRTVLFGGKFPIMPGTPSFRAEEIALDSRTTFVKNRLFLVPQL